MIKAKQEGTSVLYDPEGFDSTAALDRYHKLNKKWFKTKRVKAEMEDLDGALTAYEQFNGT